jgi:hypothetical protein
MDDKQFEKLNTRLEIIIMILIIIGWILFVDVANHL